MNGSASALVDRVREAGTRAAKLTLYRISPSLKTLIAVTPAALESFPDVRIDEIEDAATIASAIEAIVASAPEPSDANLDARSGLVFSDLDGSRVLAVYKGRFPSDGQIDLQRCAFEHPALQEWLDAH